jgi:hypothetical protein
MFHVEHFIENAETKFWIGKAFVPRGTFLASGGGRCFRCNTSLLCAKLGRFLSQASLNQENRNSPVHAPQSGIAFA